MKKTIKKRAFVSAIAMLIVSAIVLTSSTFAWFTMSKSGTVEQMDLTVSSPEGIQISANANTWPSTLTVEELFDTASTSRNKAYDGNKNFIPKDLFPVSSALAAVDANGTVPFFKAVLNDSKYGTVTKVTQTPGNGDACGLVAFDIFFKVAAETKVYFSDSVFTDTSDSQILTALRVAFVPLGNVAGDAAASSATALSTYTKAKTIMYEPDATNRSQGALDLGASAGAQTTNYFNAAVSGNANGNNQIVNSSTIASAAGVKLTDSAAAADKSFILSAGITKMRVYIWVEGNDIDCQNTVAGSTLSAQFVFTID